MNEQNYDGWPSWLDIRRGMIGLILIIAPAIILSTYLPSWIQSYQITGEALWELKKKGVPDKIIQPMLAIREKSFFLKSSLLNEAKKLTPDIFYEYRQQIESDLISIPVNGSEYIAFSVLCLFYLIIWRFLQFYEGRGIF